jgi:hypothetical protein
MSQGKLIGSVMAALAKFERDLLRKRIRSGVAAARVRRVDVLVPANMLGPNAAPRNDGVAVLDLTTFTTNPISEYLTPMGSL